jgi:hypothetical protein
LELTENAANKLGRHFCPETADQVDEGYMDDGHGGGKDDVIDTMTGEISEDDGQLYLSGNVAKIMETLSMRPKFMARGGETDERILNKISTKENSEELKKIRITSEIEAVDTLGVIQLLHVPLCDVECPHASILSQTFFSPLYHPT